MYTALLAVPSLPSVEASLSFDLSIGAAVRPSIRLIITFFREIIFRWLLSHCVGGHWRERCDGILYCIILG